MCDEVRELLRVLFPLPAEAAPVGDPGTGAIVAKAPTLSLKDAPDDALNSGTGLRWLEPRRTWTVSWASVP